CNLGSECTSEVCRNGRCAAPACDDGLMNGAETDVDCGGDCAPCMDNQRCREGADCQSQVCDNGYCAVPRCGDGVVNQPSEECDEGPLGGQYCSPECEVVGCPPEGKLHTYLDSDVCVGVPSPQSVTKTQAYTVCQGIGNGWTLCPPDVLCDPAIVAMLPSWGCMCGGGQAACGAGISGNIYLHVQHPGDASLAYWIRQGVIPNCTADNYCQVSGSETLGAPVCCLGLP